MSQFSDGDVSAARDRALKVFAVLRAHKARFYREQMGIRLGEVGDGTAEGTMEVSPLIIGPRGRLAPGALATLADFILGAAVRTRIGPGHRTPTVGLMLQYFSAAVPRQIRVRAQAVAVTDDVGTSHCSIYGDGGELVAFGIGSFAVRPAPKQGPWFDYSADHVVANSSVPPVDPADLDEEERALLERVEDSVRNAGQYGPYGQFLGIEWESRGAGHAVGTWRLGPHVWNRIHHAQGGSVFGALSSAAQACLPDDAEAWVLEQHVQYARPCQGDSVRVEAEVVRQGARLISVRASISDEAGQVTDNALITLQGARTS